MHSTIHHCGLCGLADWSKNRFFSHTQVLFGEWRGGGRGKGGNRIKPLSLGWLVKPLKMQK